MSAAESWDQLAAIRPAAIRPSPPMDIQAPVQEVPAPTPEQARATDAVFSNDENAEAGAIMGLWAAGMIANDLIREAAINLAEDEETEKKNKKRPGPQP
jgi:hypothetical protein